VFCAILLSVPWGLAADEELSVKSVNYPLHYIAERLATDSFSVDYIIDAGIDPAFWEPSDEALNAFQQADVILLNGAGYAKWMKTVSLPRSKMVDTSKPFAASYLESHGDTHQHGEGATHAHGGTAFTTWIDLKQVAMQAEAVATRFKALRPLEAAQIDENLSRLQEDLSALDAQLVEFGRRWGDKPLVASHPIYQYFARAYGLRIEALVWEPEMEITSHDLADLKALLGKHGANWMIWEDFPSDGNIEALAALGLKSVVFSPAANRPEQGDWLDVMKQNVTRLNALFETDSAR
tara:strand:+ start:1429 stop:2310 length:882 start_codon:yes stop_codon:yes gene_type:complete